MAKKNKNEQPAEEKPTVETPAAEETTKEETTDSGENHDADQGETKEEKPVVEETTEETTEEKEIPAEEKPEEKVTAEVEKPTKPKKEWTWSFKPGDSVAIWGTGNAPTMKKGKKFNTTGAMAAILIENGSGSLEEIKPDPIV